jgi:hypothetical protein
VPPSISTGRAAKYIAARSMERQIPKIQFSWASGDDLNCEKTAILLYYFDFYTHTHFFPCPTSISRAPSRFP